MTENKWDNKPEIQEENDIRVIRVQELNISESQQDNINREAQRLEEVIERKKAEFDEKNRVVKEAFSIINDVDRKRQLFYKTVLCKYGENCTRNSSNSCNFYHNKDDRKIPMCPFKQYCNKKNTCNYCHPGQEIEWLAQH